MEPNPDEERIRGSRDRVILGFGACMIGGSPFEFGLLHVTLLKQKAKGRNFDLRIKSMPRFTAVRARKHLRHALMQNRPDIVVLQFGATDADVRLALLEKLKDLSRKPSSHSSKASIKDAVRPFSWKSHLKWRALSALAYASKQRKGDLTSYLDSVTLMTEQILEFGATPIVLSPFVYGQSYKNRNGVVYRNALMQLQTKFPKAILLDCISKLKGSSRSQILMHDGLHLATYGHYLLGELVSAAVDQVVDNISLEASGPPAIAMPAVAF